MYLPPQACIPMLVKAELDYESSFLEIVHLFLFLFYLKLIDWISVTLDAHFTQLILTPEARDVLTNLQKCVKQHVSTP